MREWAVIMHVKPNKYSAAELRSMYVAYQKDRWQHTARIEAAIYNTAMGRKKRIDSRELNQWNKVDV